jgi:Tetratricopeptide repeat
MAGVHETNGEHDLLTFDLFQKAQYTIFVDRLCEADLTVARVLNSLSINHARRRDSPAASKLCSKALEIRRSQLGTAHLDTCDTLYNIGNVVDEWRKFDDAMKYYTSVVRLLNRIMMLLGQLVPYTWRKETLTMQFVF